VPDGYPRRISDQTSAWRYSYVNCGLFDCPVQVVGNFDRNSPKVVSSYAVVFPQVFGKIIGDHHDIIGKGTRIELCEQFRYHGGLGLLIRPVRVLGIIEQREGFIGVIKVGDHIHGRIRVS